MRNTAKKSITALVCALALALCGCLPPMEGTTSVPEQEQEAAPASIRQAQSQADPRRVTIPIEGASPAQAPSTGQETPEAPEMTDEEYPPEEVVAEEEEDEEETLSPLSLNVDLVRLIGSYNDALVAVNGEACEPELIYGGTPYLDYSSMSCEYPYYFILEPPAGEDPGELWRQEWDRTGDFPTTNFWPNSFQIISVSVPSNHLWELFRGVLDREPDYDDLCELFMQYPSIEYTPAGTNDSDSWMYDDSYGAVFNYTLDGNEYGISCNFYESGGRYILKGAGITIKSSDWYEWLAEW